MFKYISGQPFLLWILHSSLFFIFSCASLSKSVKESSASSEKIDYSQTRLSSEVPFVEHKGSEVLQNYLAQNVEYSEVAKIRISLEKWIGKTLKNRGEAHVTVLSPVEFKNSKKAQQLGMAAISASAQALKIQKVAIEPLCIGRGVVSKNLQSGKDSAELETYFIVLKPQNYIELRTKLKEEFNLDNFDSHLFFPHITLGFTERDLHYEDGVKKDITSCFIKLNSTDLSPQGY